MSANSQKPLSFTNQQSQTQQARGRQSSLQAQGIQSQQAQEMPSQLFQQAQPQQFQDMQSHLFQPLQFQPMQFQPMQFQQMQQFQPIQPQQAHQIQEMQSLQLQPMQAQLFQQPPPHQQQFRLLQPQQFQQAQSQQAQQAQPNNGEAINMEQIYQWINDVPCPTTRERALAELAHRREFIPDLAPMLWHSFGTMTACVQEIVNIYTAIIPPPTLNAHQSNRVCNALALLQCVASHHETRTIFAEALIPSLILPFLNTTAMTSPFEHLRLTTLGVIGALVKSDQHDIIESLLATDLIPYCLRIMQRDAELSKTVATFILQKLLQNDNGLNYVCSTYERFSDVARILGELIINLVNEPSARLFKHVIRCYYRLTDNPRARIALSTCIPDQLKDNTFMPYLANDLTTKHILVSFLKNLESSICSMNAGRM